MDKVLEQKVNDLEKRIADLEGQIQNQQKEFEEAIAFLFDRSEFKGLIEKGKLEWPISVNKAIKKYLNY